MIQKNYQAHTCEFVVKNKDYIEKYKNMWLLASSNIDVIVKNPEMEDLDEEDRLISRQAIRMVKSNKIK